MTTTFKIISLLSFLLCIYFFFMRFDVIVRIFKKGIFDFGELLLPIMLLIIAISIYPFKKNEKNEK